MLSKPMQKTATTSSKALIDAMFNAGAHFGYSRAKRHPSMKPFIFGVKNKVELFDLEKTSVALQAAKDIAYKIASEGRKILFVASKSEAQDILRNAARDIEAPYVAGRWLGGTLTNFTEIKRRVAKLESMTSAKEKGELAKYTKKERLLMDRELSRLETLFGGIATMKDLPAALFVIDAKHEHIAVKEAQAHGIPVIALCGSDCDVNEVTYAIPGNDSSITSIAFFVKEIASAIKEGRKAMAPAAAPAVAVSVAAR